MGSIHNVGIVVCRCMHVNHCVCRAHSFIDSIGGIVDCNGGCYLVFDGEMLAEECKKCRRCIYRTMIGHCGDVIACFYMGITYKRRQCPVGEDCTRFIEGPSIMAIRKEEFLK